MDFPFKFLLWTRKICHKNSTDTDTASGDQWTTRRSTWNAGQVNWWSRNHGTMALHYEGLLSVINRLLQFILSSFTNRWISICLFVCLHLWPSDPDNNHQEPTKGRNTSRANLPMTQIPQVSWRGGSGHPLRRAGGGTATLHQQILAIPGPACVSPQRQSKAAEVLI